MDAVDGAGLPLAWEKGLSPMGRFAGIPEKARACFWTK
jgi:hypothetical protein